MNIAKTLRKAIDDLNQIAENKVPYETVVALFTAQGYHVNQDFCDNKTNVSKQFSRDGIEVKLMIDVIPAGIREGVPYQNVGMYGTIRPLFRHTEQRGPITVEQDVSERFYQQRWDARQPANSILPVQSEITRYQSLVDCFD